MPQAAAPQPKTAAAPAQAPRVRPAGGMGPAAAPREEPRAGAPGHSFAQVRVHAGAVPALQAKLTISQPGDPYEQEAERVADEVVRASAAPSVAERPEGDALQAAADDGGVMVGVRTGAGSEEDEEVELPPLPAPVELEAPPEEVQRAAGEAEEEESEEPGDEAVHRRAAASGDDPTDGQAVGMDAGSVLRGLSAARGGGQPLPDAARSGMERAFGADFASVRIHDDPAAHRLSRSINALAFTHREHIFFAPGRFDPGSGEGRRLLAHELTHVVQQSPGVRGAGDGAAETPGAAGDALSRSPLPGAEAALVAGSAEDGALVQREEGGAPDYKMVARIYFFDGAGNVIFESGLLMPSHPGLPGVHSATLSGAPGKRILQFADVSITIFKDAPGMGAALGKAKSISITVFSGGGSKPGGTGDKDKDPGQGGEKKEKKEGDGKPGVPGSKYGWLGLLELDQETIDMLEDVFEALEDEEEFLALQDTLRALSDLGTHASSIQAWFSDTDRLLAIALGLEDNAAVSALQSWVERAPTKRKLTATRPERKGIVGVAIKVMGIIEKVRRVLRPVFRVRATFVELFGSVAVLIEAMPVIQYLLDEANRGKVDAGKLLNAFSGELATTLHKKMEGLRKSFAVKVESFGAEEMITAEEVGRVVLSAGLKAVPGAGKLVVKVGTKIPGLEGLIADKLVAPLIPKAALDQLNGTLLSLGALLQPAAKQAAADLDGVFKGLEEEIAKFLSKEMGEIALMLDAGAGGGRNPGAGEARFRGLMGASQGESLPEGVRGEMEGHLGFDFARVRIHRDAAAGRASEMVGANAFTLGRDVFFGPGRYDPASGSGRRLLAHELAHVVQQDGADGEVLQRDYKALQAKLVRKVGDSVKGAMKVAVGGSPAKQAAAKDIRDNELEKLRGRKVVSENNPKLPEAYFYAKDGVGNIKSIRRKLSWIRYVPSLTIDPGGRIKLGAEFNYDPKDADRRALRSACGCTTGYQAHHVVPLELRGDPIVKLAESNGFQFNGLDNGVCLSDTVHSGSHKNYTGRVRGVLAALAVKHGTTAWTPALKTDFDAEMKVLHTYCKKKKTKLT